MTPPSLWDRVRGARVVQVLVVYLGASWVVLQLVDTLMDLLTLPGWLGPVTVALLAIGAVVVASTAWVQSLEATTRAEEAGERPSDWEVDPADLVERLKAGRLPQLTWARAIAGGVVALSLAVGAAGAYVLLFGAPSLIGPTPVAASAPRTAVAVLPFQTRGDDLAVYGEGMVDLLTANLDGLGGLRTVDAGTVLARWRSQIGDDFTVELDRALEVAGGLEARYALRGTVVPIGGQVRISVDIFDLASGERVEATQVEGAAADMVALVEGLSVDLAGIFVGRSTDLADRIQVGTRSLPAMEAYLRGETLYRTGRFREAAAAFAEAVAADSLFAVAYWRMSDAWGWNPTSGANQAMNDASDRANALADRLPPRARFLTRADAGLNRGNQTRYAELRDFVSANPDDSEAVALLAEYMIHVPWVAMPEPGEVQATLDRAVALAPTFPPHYLHPLYLAVDENRSGDFERLLAGYRSAGADRELVDVARSVWNFYRGGPAERETAEEALREMPGALAGYFGFALANSDDLARRFVDASELRVDEMIPAELFPPFLGRIWAGLGPDEWPDIPVAVPAGWLWWSLLVGPPDEVPDVVRATLATDPSASDAASTAMLAALVGDAALRDEALAAFSEMDLERRPVFVGLHHGAASVEELRNSLAVIDALRMGDANRAVERARATLELPAFDALARVLMGDALAAAGDWDEAVVHWRPLLISLYRAPVRIRLARAHEALGDREAALEAYLGVVTMWSDADPMLPPLVEAERAIARLRP